MRLALSNDEEAHEIDRAMAHRSLHDVRHEHRRLTASTETLRESP